MKTETPVTSLFLDAVAKIKDLINYGGEKPTTKGLLKDEDTEE